MSNQRYTPEFKDEAVRQDLEGGHTYADISKRLGISTHRLYKWVNAVKPNATVGTIFGIISTASYFFVFLVVCKIHGILRVLGRRVTFCKHTGPLSIVVV